jgi:hypothetical protein
MRGEFTKDPLQSINLDSQLLQRQRKRMIRNRKPKHPIPEENNESTPDDKDNPNEDVGEQPSKSPMDVECDGAIVEDIDKQDGKGESRGRSLDEDEAGERGGIHTVHFMA